MSKIKSFLWVVFLWLPTVGWSAGQPDLTVIQKAVALDSEPAKGVLSHYTDVERAMKAMGIAKQYATLILRKK